MFTSLSWNEFRCHVKLLESLNTLLLYCFEASLHTSFGKMASVQAAPQLTLVDEKVNINLRGLEPGSKVTLRSQLNEMRMKFESHAHYQADEKGELSLAHSASTGGSFTGKLL